MQTLQQWGSGISRIGDQLTITDVGLGSRTEQHGKRYRENEGTVHSACKGRAGWGRRQCVNVGRSGLSM